MLFLQEIMFTAPAKKPFRVIKNSGIFYACML